MKLLVSSLVVLGLFSTLITQGQQSAQALESDAGDLQERYQLMKEKSQTYNDYKVIKGVVLDGFWKMTMDSVRKQQSEIRAQRNEINTLKREVNSLKATIAKGDSTLAEMEYDVTHIRVLGIDANKGLFAGVVGLIILGLIVLVGLLVARSQYITRSMREKTETVSSLTDEFEAYKRSALDKQMKLSRELQDERNKLQELGHM